MAMTDTIALAKIDSGIVLNPLPRKRNPKPSMWAIPAQVWRLTTFPDDERAFPQVGERAIEFFGDDQAENRVAGNPFVRVGRVAAHEVSQ